MLHSCKLPDIVRDPGSQANFSPKFHRVVFSLKWETCYACLLCVCVYVILQVILHLCPCPARFSSFVFLFFLSLLFLSLWFLRKNLLCIPSWLESLTHLASASQMSDYKHEQPGLALFIFGTSTQSFPLIACGMGASIDLTRFNVILFSARSLPTLNFPLSIQNRLLYT